MPGMGGADVVGRGDAVEVVVGRHPDVGDDDVGAVGVDRRAQRVGVADGVDDVDLAGLDEQPAGALADEVVVLGKDDGDHVLAPLVTAGRWQRTTVPPAGPAATSMVPPMAATRSPMLVRPLPRRWPSIPTPSSTTSIASPASQRSRTHDPIGGGVLGDVRQGLADDEPRGALDRRVEALGGDRRLDVDGDVEREAGGPLLEGDDEAVVGQHLREDAVDEVADLAERAAGVLLQLLQRGVGARRVARAAACGPASPWR